MPRLTKEQAAHSAADPMAAQTEVDLVEPGVSSSAAIK